MTDSGWSYYELRDAVERLSGGMMRGGSWGDAHTRMLEAIRNGRAVVLLGVDCEPLDDGPMIRENGDGTVELRLRTRPADVMFAINCRFHAEGRIGMRLGEGTVEIGGPDA